MISFYCKCPVVLPHGALCWSAVCHCGISGSDSLTFTFIYAGNACSSGTNVNK